MALQPLPTQSPPSKVNPETATKAVDALLKWHKSKAKNQKAQLLEHDEFVYLILTIKKIPPKGRTNPYKIPLPNPLHPFDSSEELCLIIDDRPKSSLTSESAKKKIQSENIPISKVLKFSKLKTDFRPFEAKRKLCSSYDLFFADKRIIPLLPRHLGKEFFKKKKIPIPVDLGKKNWKEQIQGGCRSALLFLRTGTCSVVKVGRVSQGRDEIVDNVIAAIDGVAEIVPKKWGNVRSFHLKLTDSLALPVYQTVPDVGLKIEGVRKLEEESNVDSLVESGEESVGEGKEKKSSGKSKKKRGRIHEVRYMDNGEIMDDMFSDQGNDDESNADVGAEKAELTGKKRKKAKGLVVDEKLDKGEGVSKKNKKKKITQAEGKGGEEVNNEELVDDVKKATKSKQKAATGKKKVTQLEGKGEEQLDNEELVGDVKKATKSKKKDATGKKITQSEGKGREQVNNEEFVGDDLVGDVKKATKSEQKAATGKKKKIAVSAMGKGREIDDNIAIEGDRSVSSDIKKKKKTKVSGGIKLKSKKTRE